MPAYSRYRMLATILLLSAPAVAWAADSAPPQPDGALWRIAWITDTQTSRCEWITTLVDRLRKEQPQMVIHTGDTRFEWANQCAWQDVMELLRSASPPLEFHMAPGNHDDIDRGRVKPHLREAASRGVYRLDTGVRAANRGFYHNRVTVDATGPLWPAWNPEVITHPTWQPDGGPSAAPPEGSYRYVFKRGGIRFIVADCYYSDEQRDWIRDLIVQPDDSSVTILLQHEHTIDKVARYFEGLEGQHNVKLVLNGHDHNYALQERHGVTFITGAGVSEGPLRDSDAMILRVFGDRLQLDRYLLKKGEPMPPVEGPTTIWTCQGSFTPYRRPEFPPIPSESTSASMATKEPPTSGLNLVYNGNFDNGIWYERFRGWSPAGWYQWFTCGDHAPEHAVGNDTPHSGKEYVRIHMWAHRWRGGVLQNVGGVEPGHWYRLSAYGWFAPTAKDPQPQARIGLEPFGKLREQFAADVTRHPAPPYNECVGQDPRKPEQKWPDLPETTAWSEEHDYSTWGRFETVAEAQSDVVTAILYCNPRQRSEPIYEMNWDSVRLEEIPWPHRRLAPEEAVLKIDERIKSPMVTVRPKLRAAQVVWKTPVPAGAAQVLYRFLDSQAVNHLGWGEKNQPSEVRLSDFPFETPVVYERAAKDHWVSIEKLDFPAHAAELHIVALARTVIDGRCQTVCSPVVRIKAGQEGVIK